MTHLSNEDQLVCSFAVFDEEGFSESKEGFYEIHIFNISLYAIKIKYAKGEQIRTSGMRGGFDVVENFIDQPEHRI